MSHRHHDTPDPDPDPIHSVNQPHDDFDPEMLDAALAAMGEDAENTQYYLGKCAILSKKSEEYLKRAKIIIDSPVELETKIMAAFCMGFVAGGPCALMALDYGFIGDGGQGDDDMEGPDSL